MEELEGKLERYRDVPYVAFEVYLKEKLKERGIQNDYLVNYRLEE